MYVIENSYLRVEIHSAGAELRSLYDKKQLRELLWQRDPKFWGKSSPVLFPFVGELKDGNYRHDNETYKMPKHGFARNCDFEVVRHTEEEISFLSLSTDVTKQFYPFDFELYLHYKLHHTRLSCTYEVRNRSSFDMLFSIGGHPAFQLDLSPGRDVSDYYLAFPDDHMLKRYFIRDGLLHSQPQWQGLEGLRLYLQNDMFKDDAWVLKDLRSTEIYLKNRIGDYQIKLDFAGFPYLGLWAPMGAPFICVEPWCGVNDLETHTGDLERKEGVIRLDPFSKWRKTWGVTVGQN
ncbi:aldose 1-epimerase family protein [Sphingobacterium sp. DN00404]|uniref:Aldose 1-epimerase family protein n=1 Tax=Sphingobacterium micropteri TaxID=2763501 RepID=A0ABR7YKC9_9SPHI|nr:aldose 1-epimerase family protein [Sphingobacterium micropteri]MBD1431752.1 aldose 1-epimerase family protein [Sphingobacterium micropteri]